MMIHKNNSTKNSKFCWFSKRWIHVVTMYNTMQQTCLRKKKQKEAKKHCLAWSTKLTKNWFEIKNDTKVVVQDYYKITTKTWLRKYNDIALNHSYKKIKFFSSNYDVKKVFFFWQWYNAPSVLGFDNKPSNCR